MLVPDGPLVRAEQPAFEQGNHPMHARQQRLAFALAASNAAVVDRALQGLLKKSGGALPVLAPKGPSRTVQGQLCPELVERQSAALGTEPTRNQTVARRAYTKELFQQAH